MHRVTGGIGSQYPDVGAMDSDALASMTRYPHRRTALLWARKRLSGQAKYAKCARVQAVRLLLLRLRPPGEHVRRHCGRRTDAPCGRRCCRGSRGPEADVPCHAVRRAPAARCRGDTSRRPAQLGQEYASYPLTWREGENKTGGSLRRQAPHPLRPYASPRVRQGRRRSGSAGRSPPTCVAGPRPGGLTGGGRPAGVPLRKIRLLCEFRASQCRFGERARGRLSMHF